MKRAEKWFVTLSAFALAIFLITSLFRLISNGSGKTPKLADISAFRVPYDVFRELDSLSVKYNLPMPELLAVCSRDLMFFPDKSAVPSSAEIERRYILNYSAVRKRVSDKNTEMYEEMFRNILSEARVFPIPGDYGPDTYVFSDSWGSSRLYGGDRIHEGTDILDRENVRGRLPVISMTDGKISDAGWNELGGFHVGITTENGTYYYYAHFDRLEEGLTKDTRVKAGQLLGYMGDTGYGKEGSKGKFPVHLHVGICPSVAFTDKEFWINPYPFLRSLEEKRISEGLVQMN
jgi:murein DD-endopeptidase MepM/ murein hydrolase activator NlpD